MRLDRFISQRTALSNRAIRLAIAGGGVSLNGRMARDQSEEVDPFCEVVFEGETLQSAKERIYMMLHKPVGYLCATRDENHPTVLDLIDHPAKKSLHLAGRLDRSSSGLVLLTNDSAWSERLTQPDNKVAKVYRVETVDPIPPEAVRRFREGFYFATENITTRPAELELLGEKTARVTISEGKYHQIKRMFHRVNQNRLVSLHRERIGDYLLPDDLKPGEWRLLDRRY